MECETGDCFVMRWVNTCVLYVSAEEGEKGREREERERKEGISVGIV